MDKSKEFGYVKSLFNKNIEHKDKYAFRDKLEHTKRVFFWANRLLKYEKADRDIVLTATIFHDVGYIYSDIEHPKYSVEICEQYMRKANYQKKFIKKVLDIIENHGNKDLLFTSNTSKEQILLIEADCLDESGALSVLRDAISEGILGGVSYYKTYERLCKTSIITNPNKFYCVTDTAKRIWKDKQELYIKFIDSLKNDLVDFDDYLI